VYHKRLSCLYFKVDWKLEFGMFFGPRGKKSQFTPYSQGVKLFIILRLCKNRIFYFSIQYGDKVRNKTYNYVI
jgi:hypothetical protein